MWLKLFFNHDTFFIELKELMSAKFYIGSILSKTGFY
jgi:hypothetical protein